MSNMWGRLLMLVVFCASVLSEIASSNSNDNKADLAAPRFLAKRDTSPQDRVHFQVLGVKLHGKKWPKEYLNCKSSFLSGSSDCLIRFRLSLTKDNKLLNSTEKWLHLTHGANHAYFSGGNCAINLEDRFPFLPPPNISHLGPVVGCVHRETDPSGCLFKQNADCPTVSTEVSPSDLTFMSQTDKTGVVPNLPDVTVTGFDESIQAGVPDAFLFNETFLGSSSFWLDIYLYPYSQIQFMVLNCDQPQQAPDPRLDIVEDCGTAAIIYTTYYTAGKKIMPEAIYEY